MEEAEDMVVAAEAAAQEEERIVLWLSLDVFTAEQGKAVEVVEVEEQEEQGGPRDKEAEVPSLLFWLNRLSTYNGRL